MGPMEPIIGGFTAGNLGPTQGQLSLNSRSNSGPTQAKLKGELGSSAVNARNDFIRELLFVYVFTAILSGVGGKLVAELDPS